MSRNAVEMSRWLLEPILPPFVRRAREKKEVMKQTQCRRLLFALACEVEEAFSGVAVIPSCAGCERGGAVGMKCRRERDNRG